MNIGDARLAIFNGEPNIAMNLMESAKSFLSLADQDASSRGATTPGDNSKAGNSNPSGAMKIRSVPVDGQLAMADDFVMTPGKKGDHANGLEELRLGAIDGNHTRWWLPIAPTETHRDQAIKLANEGTYYEVNLALKSIEDSVTIDSISFIDLPKSTKGAS